MLSRFEDQVDTSALQRLIDFTVETGVKQFQRKHGRLPDHITLDSDTIDDPTHGQSSSLSFTDITDNINDQQRTCDDTSLSRLASYLGQDAIISG